MLDVKFNPQFEEEIKASFTKFKVFNSLKSVQNKQKGQKTPWFDSTYYRTEELTSHSKWEELGARGLDKRENEPILTVDSGQLAWGAIR